MRLLQTLMLVSCLTLLVACGQKGPLYLPDQPESTLNSQS